MLRIRIALLLLTLVSSAQAKLLSVTMTPTHPSADDSIKVEVRGYVPNDCYVTPTNPKCTFLGSSGLAMDIEAREQQPICDQAIDSYTAVCNFGTLALGTYTFVVTENLFAWGGSSQTDSKTVTFNVAGETPALHVSWGVLKSRYE